MARKREFNFDEMLGTGPKPETGGSRKARITGTREGRKGRVPRGTAGLVESLDAEPASIEQQPDLGIQEPASTGNQEPESVTRRSEGAGAEVPADLIEALLRDHAGLRTGTAKKTTFDFTPEFARALKRWSVDTDMSMRDLVVRAVAQAMPPEYLQKYRKPGVHE